mmetsp:Transcript_40554/g.130394  ORF Transcript_40554/g.130394 Transcript_40554/m.130394 type:complete len:276 (+) Transcript_40554:2493-3320(+)
MPSATATTWASRRSEPARLQALSSRLASAQRSSHCQASSKPASSASRALPSARAAASERRSLPKRWAASTCARQADSCDLKRSWMKASRRASASCAAASVASHVEVCSRSSREASLADKSTSCAAFLSWARSAASAAPSSPKAAAHSAMEPEPTVLLPPQRALGGPRLALATVPRLVPPRLAAPPEEVDWETREGVSSSSSQQPSSSARGRSLPRCTYSFRAAVGRAASRRRRWMASASTGAAAELDAEAIIDASATDAGLTSASRTCRRCGSNS